MIVRLSTRSPAPLVDVYPVLRPLGVLDSWHYFVCDSPKLATTIKYIVPEEVFRQLNGIRLECPEKNCCNGCIAYQSKAEAKADLRIVWLEVLGSETFVLEA